MMLSNSLKRSMVVVAILMSCGAFAQDHAGDIVATIESDDPETLELFLDWAGIRASVRASFRDQGMEMPDGLEDWLAEIRGLLTITNGKIPIRTVGADKREAQNFVDELFYVFRNSAFRQQCIERLFQEQERLQVEASEIRHTLGAGMGEWRDPEQISQEYRSVKESLFELDFNNTKTNARLQAVRVRIEEHKNLTEMQVAAAELKMLALRKALENRRTEIEKTIRLVDKEFATEGELSVEEQRLLEQESELAEQMSVLVAIRQGQGDDTIRELKSTLIESESELAAMLAYRKLIEEKTEELKRKLQMAGTQAVEEAQLEARMRRLAHAMGQLERGHAFPLIPVEGVPRLRLRWVN